MTAIQSAAALEVFDQILEEQPVYKAKDDVDDRLPRFMFNPFIEHSLSLQDMKLFGMTRVPAGVIFPLREFGMIEQDFSIIGKLEHLDINEAIGLSEFTVLTRRPGVVARAMKAEFGESFAEATGFCEVEALTGNTDLELARDLNRFFFSKTFQTADETLKHLHSLENEVAKLDEIFQNVLRKLIWSYETAKEWAKSHYQRLITSLEAFANNRPGKQAPSKFDVKVCLWLGNAIPRVQSKIADQGQAQKVQVEVVQAQGQAPQQAYTGEMGDCPHCWMPIPVRNGKFPPYCFNCGKATVTATEVASAYAAEETENEALNLSSDELKQIENFDPDDPMGEKTKEQAGSARNNRRSNQNK